MFASDFDNKKESISKYFHNTYKWKSKNEDWEYQYYKGKKNLQELEFIVDVIFGNDLSVIKTKYIYDCENELIGASLIGSVEVSADFNGMKQGLGKAIIYIMFSLSQYEYWYNQSDKIEGLI